MEKAKKGTQLHKQIALWLLEQKHELPQQLINFLHKIIDQERKRLGPHKLIVQNGIGYGIMDCALISEKDATIIDWKTGSWKKKQLEHYALGLKSEHAKIMVIDPLKFKVDQWSVNPSLLTKQYQDFWSYKLVGTKLKGKALREIFDRIQKKKENDWARWLFTVPPEQLAKMTDGKKLQQFIQRYWFEAEMRGQYQYKDKLHNFEKQGDIAGLMKHLNIK